MANFQSLGTGPVSFLDGNQSQQEIPLSAISFGPSGPDASAWPHYIANKTVVDALLKQMVLQGLLVQGTQTVASPSLTVTAATAGTAGNMITVTFSSPSASAGTVTVAVNATEVYPGLTPAALSTALAPSAAASTALVFLSSQAAGNPMPAAFTGAITGPGFTLVVPDAASAPAFTVGATDQSYTVNITVALDPPKPSSPQTFTLTATGTKTAAGVTLATLQGATNPFELLVTFSGPTGGPLPAAGAVTLHGGSAASTTPASPAAASVLSS
jgi:hypothetical protein